MARGHARRNDRRPGTTLLELLLVIGILVALIGLALPLTLRTLQERELSATEENFASELLKARVRAQESGRPVEVVVVEGAPARIVLRYFDIESLTMVGNTSRSTKRASAHEKPSKTASRSAAPSDSWWEESEIDSAVRVSTQASADDDARSADSAENASVVDTQDSGRETRGFGGNGGGGGPLRVAVFLPDGSILFAASLLLLHENGLRSHVSVDPWTGQPAINRGSGASGSPDLAERPETDQDAPRDGADSRRRDDVRKEREMRDAFGPDAESGTREDSR